MEGGREEERGGSCEKKMRGRDVDVEEDQSYDKMITIRNTLTNSLLISDLVCFFLTTGCSTNVPSMTSLIASSVT
eukprot:754981-Hanusia_phi.AAC.7